ncbi:hypothetical protein [Streptomyces albipurpureus]|uniref:SRPBCC family protein n=1 Tax=Streptomyces albipurpureus TaxID=2897419 RepID=A0ABT0UHP0_9ACTN|nr:hypothetical protein [Streptomyces sp. CWNU-1]MCM2387945.1 hypothetical protein [Streptomyces sp. CWNU-1]
MRDSGTPRVWGARPDELAASYPCDDLLGPGAEPWMRAVTVRADAATTFRWLCQLKVAPYSYDSLDNLGRRSPRKLSPGAEELAAGQRVMTIFELVSFETDRHLTLLLTTPRAVRLFGDFALTYAVLPEGADSTRLVVKMVVGRRPGVLGAPRMKMMAWGDLLMMRRQLLTLRDLAEGGTKP